ncbi:uncharacterized protein VSU04_011181 [Chlamydotis macqueenii]
MPAGAGRDNHGCGPPSPSWVQEGEQEKGAGRGAAPGPTHHGIPSYCTPRARAVPGLRVRHWELQPAAHAPRGLDGCHRLHTRLGTACPAAQSGTRWSSWARRSHTPTAKGGFCPRLPPGVVTVCLVECGCDSECPGSQKCCGMGCRVRCTPPLPAKPGVCPTRRALQSLAPCNSSCSGDADCPGGKCCFTGCGRGCLPPHRGTALPPAAPARLLLPSTGPCPRATSVTSRPRVARAGGFSYDPAAGTCQPFIYSGCGGNANNFGTVEECQRVCQRPGRAQE